LIIYFITKILIIFLSWLQAINREDTKHCQKLGGVALKVPVDEQE